MQVHIVKKRQFQTECIFYLINVLKTQLDVLYQDYEYKDFN